MLNFLGRGDIQSLGKFLHHLKSSFSHQGKTQIHLIFLIIHFLHFLILFIAVDSLTLNSDIFLACKYDKAIYNYNTKKIKKGLLQLLKSARFC